MYIFFMPLLFLPLIEIIGFLTIGAHIGLFWTLAWLCGSTVLGFYLLRIGGSGAWRRARQPGEEVFLLEEAFDRLCLLIAALLLIFPGFISDFIAIPFLIAPFRRWLFGRVKSDPENIMRRGYRRWTDGEGSSTQQTIDGEFRRVDDTTKLPK
jgi:UPF0716 protein FxsA